MTGSDLDATQAPPGVLGIHVRGRPAPQGSQRHVGGGRVVASSPYLAEWRAVVATATVTTVRATGWQPIAHPDAASVEVMVFIDRPRSHYRSGRYADILREDAPPWPTSTATGDLDKHVRSILDGITAAREYGVLASGGAVEDDAVVATVVASLRWSGALGAGAHIRVRRLRAGE